jgi:rhodanese-related sulfurtransferase
MKEISAIEVEALVKQNAPIHLIDVREDEEVATGMIPNAINIPLRFMESKLKDLDQSKEYIMICRSGNRSSMAAALLDARGYKVLNMAGGMLEYNGPMD